MDTTGFRDSPETERILAKVNGWPMPDLPVNFIWLMEEEQKETWGEQGRSIRRKLASLTSWRNKKALELKTLRWLYRFIRANVVRGRIFDLRKVLETGQADCLGYAKLFTVLGRYCGLDVGVVEVIIDNRGRRVPHTVNLVRLIRGRRQFVDFWYGSEDIRHKRLGLCLKRGEEWKIEDSDFNDLHKAEDIGYLTDSCVDAITLYVEGNRSLKEKDYAQATELYSQAIRLYPQNARIFYNRAIALENLGQLQRAQADYARALQDESSILRTLATQPEDVIDLIRLDELLVPEECQYIYLLSRGFITGRRMSPANIAEKLHLSRSQVEAMLEEAERSLAIRVK